MEKRKRGRTASQAVHAKANNKDKSKQTNRTTQQNTATKNNNKNNNSTQHPQQHTHYKTQQNTARQTKTNNHAKQCKSTPSRGLWGISEEFSGHHCGPENPLAADGFATSHPHRARASRAARLPATATRKRQRPHAQRRGRARGAAD